MFCGMNAGPTQKKKNSERSNEIVHSSENATPGFLTQAVIAESFPVRNYLAN